MPPQLVSLTEGPNILLDKPIILIGRNQECDIQIASRKISRKHCCVAQVNNVLLVRDLYSTNGVRINGKRVVEGFLQTGDELTIAHFRYQVQLQPGSISSEGQQVPQQAVPRQGGKELESCEEPVPLADSLDSLPHRPQPHRPQPQLPPANQIDLDADDPQPQDSPEPST